MNRGTWQSEAHGVAKSCTQFSDSAHTHTHSPLSYRMDCHGPSTCVQVMLTLNNGPEVQREWCWRFRYSVTVPKLYIKLFSRYVWRGKNPHSLYWVWYYLRFQAFTESLGSYTPCISLSKCRTVEIQAVWENSKDAKCQARVWMLDCLMKVSKLWISVFCCCCLVAQSCLTVLWPHGL